MLAALLFGAMRAGSGLMQIEADIPVEIIDVIQATILLFLAADVVIRARPAHPGAGRGAEELETVTKTYGSGDTHLMEVVYGIPVIGVLFQFIGYVIEVTPGIAPIVARAWRPRSRSARCAAS